MSPAAAETVKNVVEAGAPMVAFGTIAGWIAGVLPTIAAFLSILWLIMQMLMSWDKFKQLFKKGHNEQK